MRKALSFSLIFVLVFAGTALALDPASGPYQLHEGTGAYDCAGVANWEQLPNGGTALAAQDDVCYPFMAETSDDFIGDGGTIQSIGWWGVYWNGDPVAPDAFRIDIYATESDDQPGELLYSELNPNYNESLMGSEGEYCVVLTEPFPKEEGVSYHVAITSVSCFPPQWGWATGDGNGRDASRRSGFFGWADWMTTTETDGISWEMAFVMFGGGETPTEDASWTTIKQQYEGADRRHD